MRVVFRALLRLYPLRHRELLGAEMEAIFERGVEEHRCLGPARYARFLLKEAAGVVLDASRARFAEVTHKGHADRLHAIPVSEQDLPDEVLEAQSRLALDLNRLVLAIARQQFLQARFYSNRERKAREELRQLREKHGLD
jgi:hypothetical protein